MTNVQITPLATSDAEKYWSGSTDAHGTLPELKIADGGNLPCRHCLQKIEEGEQYLILAYCPFPQRQPYAEIGPIFLHAKPCAAYSESHAVPQLFANGENRIVRGYSHDNRIVYGSGKVVKPNDILDYAETLFNQPEIAYIHVRSSTNNCYSYRMDRA